MLAFPYDLILREVSQVFETISRFNNKTKRQYILHTEEEGEEEEEEGEEEEEEEEGHLSLPRAPPPSPNPVIEVFAHLQIT